MDAPRCIVCDTKHWSRLPCPAMGGIYDQRALKQARLEHARETLRQAETVTKTPPAVKTETPPVKTEQVKTTGPVGPKLRLKPPLLRLRLGLASTRKPG